ncbi:MAG: nicotinate-nucleotide--dimethylbenzimidazole phosphoribosyltransferase, partial [Anaerotignaceae bacterium]
NRKIFVIEEAIKKHKPDKNDPIDVLAKVGGLDIAGLVGMFIGAMECRLPIIIDGFISSVAALIAIKINENTKDYMFASHVSKEPAGRMLLEELKLPYYIDADMCLGEGTGAVLLFNILDMAVGVFKTMADFEEAKVDAYVPLD